MNHTDGPSQQEMDKKYREFQQKRKKYNEEFLMTGMLTGLSPREVGDVMLRQGMLKSPKQIVFMLEKWDSWGIYDYGVSQDTGWLIDGSSDNPAVKNPNTPLRKWSRMSMLAFQQTRMLKE